MIWVQLWFGCSAQPVETDVRDTVSTDGEQPDEDTSTDDEIPPHDSGTTDDSDDSVDDSTLDSATPTPEDSNGDSASVTDTATDTATVTSPTLTNADPIVVYAVRHAEKWDTGADPGLTPEGLERAEALGVMLVGVPLAAVYATDLQRTQLTVKPAADSHGLAIQTELDAEAELANHILETHSEQRVLHAGHSYTLGTFFETLGVEEVPAIVDYGQLWTVTIHPDGAVDIVESAYGD